MDYVIIQGFSLEISNDLDIWVEVEITLISDKTIREPIKLIQGLVAVFYLSNNLYIAHDSSLIESLKSMGIKVLTKLYKVNSVDLDGELKEISIKQLEKSDDIKINITPESEYYL